MAHRARLAEFDGLLQQDKINLSKLQQLCFTGIPDEGGRRALCWQLLLHYLPLERAAWEKHLRAKRVHYHTFVDDIIVRQSSLSNNDAVANSLDNTIQRRPSAPSPPSGTAKNTSTAAPHPTANHQRSASEVTCINGLNSMSISSFGSSDGFSRTAQPAGPPSSDQTMNNSSKLTRNSVSSGNITSSTNRRRDEAVLSNGGSNISSSSSGSSNSVCSDHPLNLSPDSEWGGFFKDNEILGQIDKDCRRLCPDMCFFQRPTPHPRPHTPRLCARVTYTPLPAAPLHAKFSLGTGKPQDRKAPPPSPTLPPGEEAHWEVVERVLFVYAKLNPGQGYVQGMNEIIGPIYYVLASAPRYAEHAEADCFWLFTSLMAEVRDLFIRTLDDSESGIGRLMTRLMTNLSEHDTVTSQHLEQQGIREQYFAFRWLSLLFSQEFALPDVIRVWDSVLSRQDIHDFLLQVATAMIILQRDRLLEGDFAANMKLLQNYPPCDVAEILAKAVQLSLGTESSASLS